MYYFKPGPTALFSALNAAKAHVGHQHLINMGSNADGWVPRLARYAGDLLTVWDSEDNVFPPLGAYFGANRVGLGLSSGTAPIFIAGFTGAVLGLHMWLYGSVLGCFESVLGVLLGVF